MFFRRILLFLIFLNLIALLVVGYWEYEIHFSPTSPQLHAIEIQQGMKAKDIASYLQTQGVIMDENAFLFYLWNSGQIGHLIPGTYSIQPFTTIPQLTEILTGHGQAQTVRVTIPEGSNLFEVQNDLQQAGLKISRQDFLREVSAANFLYDFLPKTDQGSVPRPSAVGLGRPTPSAFRPDPSNRKTLEGYLFPDTYEFRRDTTAHEAIDDMLANFQRRAVPEINQEHARSMRDVVITASILEKEVQTKQDMQIVAGILWKRLDAKQALQVEATAIYGRKLAQDFSLGLSADLYDTYRHTGLPPTPIGNPGITSIEAAINPVTTDYWYYLSTPEGKTIFSKTLQEHDANRIKYLH